MLTLGLPAGPLRLACLGAHCDDIEIGAGGTILRLLDEHPGSVVDWLVVSSNDARRAEAEQAAAAFTEAAGELRVQIADLPESVFPSLTAEIQAMAAALAASAPHDLVLAPARHDLHQDHRVLGEVAHQKWRNHPIWEYEIAKWDGDLVTPNLYVQLTDDVATRKLDLLERLFPSQHPRPWYDREAFAGLLRLRGIECGHRYAEGFHAHKTAV